MEVRHLQRLVPAAIKDSVGVPSGSEFPWGAFSACGASGSFGAHGLLRPASLTINCWPEAPWGWGGGGGWRPRTHGVAPPPPPPPGHWTYSWYRLALGASTPASCGRYTTLLRSTVPYTLLQSLWYSTNSSFLSRTGRAAWSACVQHPPPTVLVGTPTACHRHTALFGG